MKKFWMILLLAGFSVTLGCKKESVIRNHEIELGSWNMDQTVNKNFYHGIDDPTMIRSIDVEIYSDNGVLFDSGIGGADGATYAVAGDKITVGRTNGGTFDDPGFDDSGINRGWIHIQFLDEK